MPQPERWDIPPLSETSYSRERLLNALMNEAELPDGPVAVAALYVEEIEFDIVDVIERACVSNLDIPSGNLLFCGLHILGARRRSNGFRALVSFLRGPQPRVEDVLGDAVTMTLPKILAGMFDGNVELLLDLITDESVDEFVRSSAMSAFGFLVFDGRIDKEFAADFLQRFDVPPTASSVGIIWYAWMVNVALLGLDRLSPRVLAAFKDGRIPEDLASENDFRDQLAIATDRSRVAAEFEKESAGYIEDVLEALQGFSSGEGPGFDEDRERDFEKTNTWQPDDGMPARNPLRHVGRNDPCPCGSGKKFKKCCLIAGTPLP